MTRRYNAEYYDAITTQTDDIEFYRGFVSPTTRILELGCGTGRVSLPLAEKAAKVVGIDLSDEMISRAKAKDRTGVVQFLVGDICSLQLRDDFDLILAPFRVMQALELEQQVHGFLDVIRSHLAPHGMAILNVFRPNLSKQEIATKWCRDGETPYEDVVLANGDVLRTSDTRRRIDPLKQVMYPEIIHRLYRDGNFIDEHVNPICMHYYYPNEFQELLVGHKFRILNTWGGYKGEKYGDGPELVVAVGKS